MKRHLTSLNLSTNLLKFGSHLQQEGHVGLAFAAGIVHLSGKITIN